MIINTGGRTDTVQYFSNWLLNRFKDGYVYVRNPLFPEKVARYELSPSKVDCVVFCSKNYEPILERLNEITDKFNSYFFYTITAYGRDIEPNVPDIDKSIDTLYKLEKQVGKNRIVWRYDPVLLTKKYTIQQHFITFEHMAARLAGHVERCVFSFVEVYDKVQFNMPELILFTQEDMDELACGLGRVASKYGIILQSCATNSDYSAFGIKSGACVTLDALGTANEINFRSLKHNGMRRFCHCIQSHDIGAYDTCPNGCRYCYANKSFELAKKNAALVKDDSPILLGEVLKTDIVTYARQPSYLEKPNLQQELFS